MSACCSPFNWTQTNPFVGAARTNARNSDSAVLSFLRYIAVSLRPAGRKETAMYKITISTMLPYILSLSKPRPELDEGGRLKQQRKVSDMRITDITTFVVGNPWKNWVFVKLHTDEGLIGLGEAPGGLSTRPGEAEVHELARFLIGDDPLHP